MTAIADAVADVFADDNIATAAVHHAAGGPEGVACRVIVRAPDMQQGFGGQTIHAPTLVLDVQVAEIATVLAGDVFEINGARHVVQGKPQRDARRLVWNVDLRPG